MLHDETPISENERCDTEHWEAIKAEVMERDKCCRICASKESLTMHHITYKRFGDELADDVTLLCLACRTTNTAQEEAPSEVINISDTARAEQLNNDLSDQICNVVASRKRKCTAEYIFDHLTNVSQQSLEVRLNLLVGGGVLERRYMNTTKPKSPTVIYTISK